MCASISGHFLWQSAADARSGLAMLRDQVFSTWRAADADRGPATIGLFGDGGQCPASRSYLAQLASIFGPARCCA